MKHTTRLFKATGGYRLDQYRAPRPRTLDLMRAAGATDRRALETRVARRATAGYRQSLLDDWQATFGSEPALLAT